MDDFKQLTEQLLKFYIDTESIDDTGFENFFDDNSSIIGTGKHEFFRNLHEFQESYKFDVKQRGKIRLKIRGLQQEEAELGDDQVLALAVGVLLDQEVLLLVTHGRNDFLWRLAEQRQNALGLTRERGHGAQQRGLLVQGLARVGAESRGDAQDIVLDKGGAGGIPSGVATGLEGGAQAAVGEAGGIGLALDEVLARKLGNGGAVVVRLEEAVVLLGSDARKRLEPVRVVRSTLGDGPDLHGMGNGVGHIQVERLTALEGCSKALPNVLGEAVLHDFLREHHGPEAVSKIGHTELPSYRHRVRSGVDY